jgi:hypothetical protein
MTMPLLVQYLDLIAEHFSQHPVWISAHVADTGEPWYDDTDEETFRPWLEALPVGSDDGLFLVRATYTLADGTELPGFVTPQAKAPSANDVNGLLQGEVFLPSGRREQFWNGLIARPPAECAAFLAALRKSPGAVFPVRVAADRGLTRGHAAAVFAAF